MSGPGRSPARPHPEGHPVGGSIMASRVTVRTILEYKEQGRPVVMVTAYDYPFARLADAAGVDMILVGDSLGNVVLGYPATVFVTLDEMVHHTRAARRGVERALLVADMPFLTFHLSVDDALRAAGRLVQEGGAEAVKLEGAGRVLEVVHRLTGAGIPVVGHLGLLPQRVHALGGYRVQGRDEAEARRFSTMPSPWSRRGPSPWCWRWCPGNWPRPSAAGCGSPPSASGPGRTATARCWCSTTCWA